MSDTLNTDERAELLAELALTTGMVSQILKMLTDVLNACRVWPRADGGRDRAVPRARREVARTIGRTTEADCERKDRAAAEVQ